jgi:integrase
MMNLAERWKLRAQGTNPCRHLQRYPETKRTRYPKLDELQRIGAALAGISPELAGCIRFIALSGCRLSEGVGLMLEAVDFKTGEWTLADAKAGARTVVLGAPALALLSGLELAKGRAWPVTKHMVEKAWRRVRDQAEAPDLRIHDLRHGVGTYAGAAGLNAFIVRDLLGHRTMAMTGRYVSRHIDPLRLAADTVSGQIAAALEGKPAEVLPLRRSEQA